LAGDWGISMLRPSAKLSGKRRRRITAGQPLLPASSKAFLFK
jgi:hypothetical protein